MEERDGEPVAGELEAEIARTCGVMNAATARLVSLLAQELEHDTWQGAGIHSPTQWVAWQCGVSPARDRSLVSMARRRLELSITTAAFDAGELCEDQVAVICRHAPAGVDAEVADLARAATVSQLRRALGSYPFANEKEAEPTGPAQPTPPEEARSVSFGHTDSGQWRLSAVLPGRRGRPGRASADGGSRRAVPRRRGRPCPSHDTRPGADRQRRELGRCLRSHGRALPGRRRHGPAPPRPPPGAAARGHRGRRAHRRPLAPGPDVERRAAPLVGCDTRIRPVIEAGGKPVSVGRAFRTVPDRTRIGIELRDRGCRVPGCDRSRWLHVHHLEHWEDGGSSDTPNLLAPCRRHHRLHHSCHFGVRGNADEPDGVVFTDHRGWKIESSGRPVPPRQPVETAARGLGIVTGAWSHPTGERLDPGAVTFNERTG